MKNTPLRPEITVQLSGEDGNAFSIIARVKAHLNREDAIAFQDEAFAATSYDDLLQIAMRWVNVQ